MAYQVLLIDDEPWSRQVVKSLVEWERLDLSLIGEAEDAEMGLSMIADLQPRIVITDMRMPGMSGDDFLKVLEERFPNLKLVVLSGYDDFAYLQQALRSGAIDYLLKPVDPDDLNKTLEKCIFDLKEKKNIQFKKNSTIFKDSQILKEYVNHRKRIFAFLLELDFSSIRESLEQLENYLLSVPDISFDDELGVRIIHDFTFMLEEFLTRFGLDSQSLESLNLKSESIDSNLVFHQISELFNSAIKLIIEYQNQKGFLNLTEVKEHIDSYYHEQLSLDTVSKLFLVTKEHMSRSYKKTYGITLNDYITLLRMNKAKTLIVDEGIEIKQVAFLCGYTDLTYFYRVFKKHFGTPPGKMRK